MRRGAQQVRQFGIQAARFRLGRNLDRGDVTAHGGVTLGHLVPVGKAVRPLQRAYRALLDHGGIQATDAEPAPPEVARRHQSPVTERPLCVRGVANRVRTIMHNTSALLGRLKFLGLDADEATLYIELLRQPMTPLRLSRRTGVERTKVYRLISNLEKRSLVTRRTDDSGVSLVAADPSTLEVALVAREETLKRQRSAFNELLPALQDLQAQEDSLINIRTYEGQEGMRQMAWHDLQRRSSLLVMGGGLLEEMTGSSRWAERYRQRAAELGQPIRCLCNEPENDVPTSTKSMRYLELYSSRMVPREVLDLDYNQITIYDDTVAVYHWRENQKVGIEVINTFYAQTMRQLFEMGWQWSGSPSSETTVRDTHQD